MGITLSGLERLWAPVQALFGWVTRACTARPSTQTIAPMGLRAGTPRVYPHRSAAPARNCSASARRPLRVVRVMEASPPSSGAGRMIISGRMADVCAELERLAALEAAS